jgi:GMP synthase (glutamine-hydrolysing)
MSTVLLVKCGSTAAEVRRVHGDYDRWFLRALAPTGAAVRVVEAHAGALLPARGGDAVAAVLTGSPLSVRDREPWMAETAAWVLEQADRGLPVLGVCFGHQLLAEAYGGAVARSPRGRELGTVSCALTPEGLADPLFAGVPPAFDVAATHEDEVRRLPGGAVLLATNAWSRVQAFRMGPRVRAVQFHPELDTGALGATVDARADGLVREVAARGEDGEARLAAVRAGIRASPWGARILANFVRMAAGDAPWRSTRPRASKKRRPQGAGRRMSLRDMRLARRSERPTPRPSGSRRA